ncbi:hypothetical protein TNCV_1595721 [Trichonephila clavipes]|nr:hypothetical protein TNCV_1595721 [Trichonephila clavipes]
MRNSDCEINMFVGADVIRKLFMNESTHSGSGLSIIKTRFGYVTQGCNVNYDMTLNVHSLYVKNASASELGDLEIIGINDPIQKINKGEEQLKKP